MNSNVTDQQSSTTSENRMWPKALLTIGLGLNGAWIFLLGYGPVKIVALAI